MSILDISLDGLKQIIVDAVNQSVGGSIIALFLIVVILGALFFNYALGINFGSYALEISMFLLASVRDFFLWIVNAFKYNKKQEILFLALISLVLLILLLMAFDVNKQGIGGGITIGSGEVRFSSGGNGSKGGAGINLTGDGGSSVTVTTGTIAGSTLTTATTLPNHCFNGMQDDVEDGIDCGGGCVECHCFNYIQDVDETGVDCGGGCFDVCSCSPTGVNANCSFGYCCPNNNITLLGCENRCVRPHIEQTHVNPQPIYTVDVLRSWCADDCVNYNAPTINNPLNGSTVDTNEMLDWY